MQAAQRGKAAAPTQAEAGDPLGSQYGDMQLIQSRAQAAEEYLSINSLSEEQNGQKVWRASMNHATLSCACHSRLAATCWSHFLSVIWTYALGVPGMKWKCDAGASEGQSAHSAREGEVLLHGATAGTGNCAGKRKSGAHLPVRDLAIAYHSSLCCELLPLSAEAILMCVLVRPFMECVQVILFVDDKTVSKGMVKYATAIPRESIVDVSGEVHIPETPVAGCTCSKASLEDPPIDQA